jgi:hypothetical protein
VRGESLAHRDDVRWFDRGRDIFETRRSTILHRSIVNLRA